MAHVIEPASSARARCRGCAQPIARGELRFGERVPNAFGEGEASLWFHLVCAAFKRPEPFLAALALAPDAPAAATLEQAARTGLAHRRLPRIDGAERAPSGQAKCRHCHAPIAKGSWRIRLVFFEEGRSTPGGCVHLACRAPYFEHDDLRARVLHFSGALDPLARAELEAELDRPGAG